jgi:hypothetical protein
VNERFAAHEQQVAYMVLEADIDYVPCLLERDAAELPGIEPVDREVAEIAFGIADIGDGKLQVARSAVVENVPDQLKGALRRADDGCGHRSRKVRSPSGSADAIWLR